ncbi:diguanylate cyclase [Paenibacillus sp. S-38]|uniref:GGDEF domain-containing protein n=1 Tax=Paenibacillus sp. S-38 TaxID=3416710 RepID=UPI003CF33560
MVFDAVQQARLSRWNRRLLNGYWGIAVLTVAAASVYVTTSRWNPHYIPAAILSIHTLWMMLGLLVVEAAYVLLKRFQDYVVICGGAALSLNLITTFPQVSPSLTTLFLPILASVFYFQRRKLLFAYGLSLASFFFIHIVVLHEFSSSPWGERIAMTVILTFGTFLGLEIRRRGHDLLQDLKSTLASEQELLVRNILMDKMAKTDALTGLYNHRSFHEYLDELMIHGEQNGLGFHLALLDIDHFKKVNDTYGHQAGDAVLIRVAAVIREMVSPNDFPARYGGEEFAVLCTETGLAELLIQLERMRVRIAGMKHLELDGNPVTISVGIHTFSKGCSKEELFDGADEALYAAKHGGRNRMKVHGKEVMTLTP